jgi:putative endonuclease
VPKHNKLLGHAGEELASRFLIEKGYAIIERNWRTKLGEIDIIAFKEGTLYLVEVKTRSSISYGYPSEAINSQKLRRMQITAALYASQKKFSGPTRLLVIEVIQSSCTLIEI